MIEDISQNVIEDISQMSQKQKTRLNKYLEVNCNSHCEEDKNCSHETEFIDMLNAELTAIQELDNKINN